jgi:hypothetical protein
MPPPHPDQCQNNFAAFCQAGHASLSAWRDIPQDDKAYCSGYDWENDQCRQE